jgi:lipopolysaccharide/colanic/teichoic acid biosynthesis glycosyltransferase
MIIRAPEDLNVSVLDNTVCLLKPINRLRQINSTFLEIHKRLDQNGLLGLRVCPLDIKEAKLRQKFGKRWFMVFYPFYYILFRAIPKTRIIGPLYLFLTGYRNRWISKTEIFGRLYYCGFDVIHKEVDGDFLYVIARKDHPPLKSDNPSFYGLITLDRVGLSGEIISIHKFRTMYPYSEFLQKKVFDENKLAATGKFNYDYRITVVGKFMRKYWLDELPQIIDWLRGHIKIVGIRAMSKHYFSLYPQEYKNLYVRVKPGLLSPLFDESNTGFEEIIRIEKAYLDSYTLNPTRTDIVYFFKTLKQIFRGIRSK